MNDNDWDSVSNVTPPNSATDPWDAVSTPDLAAAIERKRRRQQGQPIEEEEQQVIPSLMPDSDILGTGEELEQPPRLSDTPIVSFFEPEEPEEEVIGTPRRVQEPRAALPPTKRKAILSSSIAIMVLSLAVIGLSVLTGLNLFHIVNFSNFNVAASAHTQPISVAVNSDRTAVVQAEATNSALSSEATVAAQPSGTYSGTTGCPATGSNFYIANVKTGLVMDDTEGSKNSGTGIIQYPYGGNSVNQQWQFVAAGTGGNFKIVNALSDLVLDEPDGSQASGIGIVQYTDNGGGLNQQWRCVFVSNNQFKIVSANSGLVLDVANVPLSEITNLQQDTYDGGLNQQWLLFSS